LFPYPVPGTNQADDAPVYRAVAQLNFRIVTIAQKNSFAEFRLTQSQGKADSLNPPIKLYVNIFPDPSPHTLRVVKKRPKNKRINPHNPGMAPHTMKKGGIDTFQW
jgi:hypothetical protein